MATVGATLPATVALAVLLLLLLLLLLLAIPIELRLHVRGAQPWAGQLALRWLFGALRLQLDLPRAARRSPRSGRDKPPAPQRCAGRGRSAVKLLRQQAFLRRALRLLGDLLRAAQVHDLALHLRLGLGDPADTGRLWGWLAPLSLATQHLHRAQLQLEPDFVDAVFEFDARAALRLVPLQWLALVLAFALSPTSLRAWRTLRTGRG